MKTIFETIKQSIYNPQFYKGVGDAPLSQGIRYYLKVSLLFAVFMTVFFGILLVPQGVRFLKKDAPVLVKKYFPADLTVHIEKGEVSTVSPEPYFVPGVEKVKEFLNAQGLENVLVVDTRSDFDKKKFNEYKTLALFTKSEFVSQNNKGQITIQELTSVPTITINQAALLSLVEKAQGFTVFAVVGALIILFFGVFMGYVGYLLILLLFALIPLAIAYIKKMKLTYATAYKMSLYAIVPALALKTLLNIVGVFFVPSSLVFLVFVLIVSLNMREIEQSTLFDEESRS